MTDEEMAEQYAVENWEHYEEGQTDYKALKQAFLAGLKAGKPQWHKVADGDLPKHCEYGTRTTEYVLVRFKYGNMGICYFDFDLAEWFVSGYPEQLGNVIAWCEIPKF